MAKSNKKLISTSTSLTLEQFIDHYVEMKYRLWDGSQFYEKRKFVIYEDLPSDPNITDKSTRTNKATRFDDRETALAFMDAKRKETKKLLMDAFGIEPDPNQPKIEVSVVNKEEAY
jgi:hypothetical protein